MKRWNRACCENGIARILRRKAASILFSLVAMVGVLVAPALPASAAGAVRKQADFNGDGYADLAIGAPGEGVVYVAQLSPLRIIDVSGAGQVHVTYGSASGLGPAQFLSRAVGNFAGPNPPTSYARFGAALAWGDFNKDGFDDLAVGVPGDASQRGAVDIYFGSRSGLSYMAGQIIRQGQIAGSWPASNGATFGYALAAGDVTGDGYADLAISQLYGYYDTGAIYLIPGGPASLNPAAGQTFTYFTTRGPSCLTMGDFNGDGHFDLAMGLPDEKVYGLPSAGAVMVAYGTPSGLENYYETWSQNSRNMPDTCEVGDWFGYALTSADFNNDGKWDLVIAAPHEDSGTGVVHILFGQSGGLSTMGNQLWSQNSPGVPDACEPGDQFGMSLAAANFDGDPYPELIVGIPGENGASGAVQVIPIVAGGTPYQFWTQDSNQIPDVAESRDHFGWSLAVGDFNKNGRPDLAISAAGENGWCGAVHILYGAGNGLTSMNNQFLMQGLSGMGDTPEAYDEFGRF